MEQNCDTCYENVLFENDISIPGIGRGTGLNITGQKLGNMYIGDHFNNLRWGHGELREIDGSIYIGQFQRDTFHGEGRLEYQHNHPQYLVYDGSFFGGSPGGGPGTMWFTSGRIYQGQWHDGIPNGKGTMIYEGKGSFPTSYLKKSMFLLSKKNNLTTRRWFLNGGKNPRIDCLNTYFNCARGSGIRDGFWKGRMPIGVGKVTFTDHEMCLEAGWDAEGQIDGKVRLSVPQWGVFDGWVHKGEIRGLGQIELESGEKYFGYFKKGMIHGWGVHLTVETGNLHDIDCRWSLFAGELRRGEWSGDGRVWMGDRGVLYEGHFENSKPEGDGVVWKDKNFREIRKESCNFKDKKVALTLNEFAAHHESAHRLWLDVVKAMSSKEKMKFEKLQKITK